ncbi:LZTR1_6 [Blepharisma stoltei]|uniref:Galactose oxidase n=1 Tax=Blepharisma stoltei TaxID=1481888 RepID=A0AAU9IX31_9CILI|nr:unnamed protein product [Blepharisma stoltei]
MKRLLWYLHFFSTIKVLAFSYSRLPFTDSPPSIRQYACADYYTKENSLIIFGGNQGSDINFNDVWEFNLTANLWNSLTPISTTYPNPRMFHGCWIDDDNSMLYIFGGRSNSGPLNDLWRYDLVNLQWKQIDQKGDIPSARSAFAWTKYKDSDGNLKLVSFAGFLKDEYTNELYIYDVPSSTWTKKPAGTQLPPVSYISH